MPAELPDLPAAEIGHYFASRRQADNACAGLDAIPLQALRERLAAFYAEVAEERARFVRSRRAYGCEATVAVFDRLLAGLAATADDSVDEALGQLAEQALWRWAPRLDLPEPSWAGSCQPATTTLEAVR